jgi:hypothetical protein
MNEKRQGDRPCLFSDSSEDELLLLFVLLGFSLLLVLLGISGNCVEGDSGEHGSQNDSDELLHDFSSLFDDAKFSETTGFLTSPSP